MMVVNGQMIDIAASCGRVGDVNTAYSDPCKSNPCGSSDVGSCVPARTLDGYYCYCTEDGLPAMRCNCKFKSAGVQF